MFDTVWTTNEKGEEVGIQIKIADDFLLNYNVGDSIDVWDGIFFGWEGCVVIKDKVIVAAFAIEDDPIFNKWGGKMIYPKIS